ncbi:hypothetical protein D9757_001083 [Collybiopsis confluens]|uniref:DUF6535 domain-containing protein n=1 Tax=Collybiopsis confluens TaxID=2823264 RepID=A0A8H5I143_9AGAR|nr:hypothetical protein D9757_001083 [Collybiopsis confluens]
MPTALVKNAGLQQLLIASCILLGTMESGPKHLFGLSQSQNQDHRVFNVDDDDYEQKFPEDPIFHETGPNARVWRTYLAESHKFDENMIGEARDGLDSMLVFAGLFSAVVTSFLVEEAQNLRPDYAQLSATLLYVLVSDSGGIGSSLPNPASKFVPDARDVWVNGLWAVSLTLSLVVALASVLVKQWLRRYLAFRSGTPAERSHLRHYRFVGFETWHVSTIVGSLPVIMHLSLALFLAGLVLFFVPLHSVLSCIIGSITLVVYVLYFASNTLPIFFPQCPYRTPCTTSFLFLGRFFHLLVLRLWQIKSLFKPQKNNSFYPEEEDSLDTETKPSSLDDLERSAVESTVGNVDDPLSVHALHWLFTTSTNTSVHSVVLQAIGGLQPHNAVREAAKTLFSKRKCKPVLEHLILSCTTRAPGYHSEWNRAPIHHLESVLERLCRTWLFLPRYAYGTMGSMVSIEYECCPDDPESVMRQSVFLSLTDSIPNHPAPDYLEFALNNRSTKHRFFVWEAFLKTARYSNAYGGYAASEYSTAAILSYYDDFLGKQWRPASIDPSKEVVLMDVATLPENAPLTQTWMLRMLARYDSHQYHRLPRGNRIIEAMLQFLLHHLWDDLPEHQFWEYLSDVLRRFDIIQADWIFHKSNSCNFSISSFITELSEKWLSRPDYEPSALERLLAKNVRRYWRSKVLGADGSELFMLQEAVQQCQSTFGPAKFKDFAVGVTGLLDALKSGSIEAHRTFINDNYLTLLFEYHKNHPNTSTALVSTFVSGLQAVESPERATFINHLFEPQNGRYAIVLLIIEQRHSWDKLSSDVHHFAKLCQQHQWLIDLREWLRLIAKFLEVTNEEDREPLETEIGMDVPLSRSAYNCWEVEESIRSLDNYLAEAQNRQELPLPHVHEGSGVVQWQTKNLEIAPGSSALQELKDVADTLNVQSSSLQHTAASWWRKVSDAVRGVGKQDLEKSLPIW